MNCTCGNYVELDCNGNRIDIDTNMTVDIINNTTEEFRKKQERLKNKTNSSTRYACGGKPGEVRRKYRKF